MTFTLVSSVSSSSTSCMTSSLSSVPVIIAELVRRKLKDELDSSVELRRCRRVGLATKGYRVFRVHPKIEFVVPFPAGSDMCHHHHCLNEM